MFQVNWPQNWQVLKVEMLANADRRGDRAPLGIFLTAKRRQDFNPAPLMYVEQETLGL